MPSGTYAGDGALSAGTWRLCAGRRGWRSASLARLDALEVRGWVLLHDLLLDGSGHRVALLVVGPSCVVIVTPFPVRDAVTTAGDQLFVDGLPYSPWLATRAWETYQVSEALTARLELGWLTVTTQWAVAVGKPLPAGLRLWNAIGLCQLEDLEHLLTSAPATLHREAVAYLAGVLDEACPPVGSH